METAASSVSSPTIGIAARRLRLDWSEWGGFAAAAEMCNNNGACARRDAAVMCPSSAPPATTALTRGRANSLRLAFPASSGPRRLSPTTCARRWHVHLVQGARRECPIRGRHGSDEDRVLHHYRRRHGLSARDRLIATCRAIPLCGADGAAAQSKKPQSLSGETSANASLGSAPTANCRGGRPALSLRPPPTPPPPPNPPRKRGREGWGNHGGGREPRQREGGAGGGPVVLLIDTSTVISSRRTPCPERVLARAGYRAVSPDPRAVGPLLRPNFLAAASSTKRAASPRTSTAWPRMSRPGTPIVGLEPLSLDVADEFLGDHAGRPHQRHSPNARFSLRNRRQRARRRPVHTLPFAPMEAGRLYCTGIVTRGVRYGGCAVSAFAAIPGLTVDTFDSTCSAWAGAFRYEAEHHELSLKIGELGVLQEKWAALPDTLPRRQRARAAVTRLPMPRREARHLVRVLDDASAAMGGDMADIEIVFDPLPGDAIAPVHCRPARRS